MRRAGRVDGIQSATVDLLRSTGWGVHITSPVGDDFPDLIVARERFTALVELKDGRLRNSNKTRLSEGQALFDAYWPGVVIHALTPHSAAAQLEAAWRESL